MSQAERLARRLLAMLAAAAVAVIAWLPAGPALAATGGARLVVATHAQATDPRTVVTFAWGGGLSDQMPSLAIFREYGMHATYFVPSGLVCTLSQARCLKSSPYLTIADIRAIAADGDEIGGLSVTHQQLTTMPVAEAKREICDDRSNLLHMGLRPSDFAYPFAEVNPTIEALTRACGYNAGLGTGTLKGAGRCDGCALAETIPPRDPYDVRTPVEVNSVGTVWTPGTYESIVTDAQHHGGGWIIFTIHDICATNCNLGTTTAILGAVLKFLYEQRSHNVVVETMRQVIGGPLRPAVAGPVPRALPPPGVVNANLAEVAGALPTCFQEAAYGGTVASFTYQHGSGPNGSGAETVRVTKAGAGDAKLVQTMDLGLCAPTVSPGRAYTAGMWYKASRPTRIDVYGRTSLGAWSYWITSPVFPATRSWRQASWTTPAVPPGTTALSFGLTTNGLGTVITSDYSFRPVKSYKNLIVLGVLLFAVLAAGLIARGQRRYSKLVKAEAAEDEAATAEAEAAKAHAARAQAELARAQARRAVARAGLAQAPPMPGGPYAGPARAQSAPDSMQPVPDTTLTQPMRAEPQDADDDTVIFKAVHPAGTGQAEGD
jgi:peptidoglycan/xylan/chitin deacetylase (PgdA/CDA1 family)